MGRGDSLLHSGKGRDEGELIIDPLRRFNGQVHHFSFAHIPAFQSFQEIQQFVLIKCRVVTCQSAHIEFIFHGGVEPVTLTELPLDLVVIIHHH